MHVENKGEFKSNSRNMNKYTFNKYTININQITSINFNNNNNK